MTAYHFVLAELESGRVAGHALICPEARYCSVRWWRRADRLDRRFVHGAGWRQLGAELVDQDWPKGYVEPTSAIGAAIVPADMRRSLSIQHVSDPSVVARNADAAQALDHYLLAQPTL